MSASLALGCCLAVWSAGPNVSLSQPRVHQARPAAAVVIPVGHVVWVEDRESILNMHATPELLFAERDLLQIEFEFSQPESCHDSHVFQPAPPAESETAAPVHPVPMHVTPAWRLRMPTLDIQPAAACDEPVSAQPPAELSENRLPVPCTAPFRSMPLGAMMLRDKPLPSAPPMVRALAENVLPPVTAEK